MQFKPNESASFKITLLVYIMILLLPFNFYFVTISFESLKNDTEAVRLSSRVGGMIQNIALNPKSTDAPQTILEIDKIFQSISDWTEQNNNSVYYIGSQNLLKDFSDINTCWNIYKEKNKQNDSVLTQQNSSTCWQPIDDFAIIVEKMVYLKQNKLINMFYISLSITMILMLLLIYFIRVYIHKQIKKHAIHDYETKLFNKKYFLSELQTSCARSVRHHYPLSILSIGIDDFKNEKYNKKTKEQILKVIGGMITSLTRASDVASRYEEDRISILLTDTESNNALVLEGRIREAFEKHDFGVTPQLDFKFATSQFNIEETPEAFVSRNHGFLK